MTTSRQLAFSGGEISPSLYARVDQVKYATGLRTCRNMFVMRQGGLANRPGTKYIAAVKDSSRAVRLIPFIFSNDDAYILEFGHNYIRFIKNGAQITSGGSPYEVATSYDEDDLPNLRFSQSADVMVITNENYDPKELSRTSDTNWTFATKAIGTSVGTPGSINRSGSGDTSLGTSKYIVTAVNSIGEESGPAEVSAPGFPTTTAKISVDWNAVTDATSYKVYRNIIPDDSSVSLLLTTTETSIDDDGSLSPDPLSYPPTDINPFGATTDDNPSAVTYFQQRLLMAGTNNNPETIWATQVGSNRNFNLKIPSQDDEGLVFTLFGSKVGRIKHMLDLSGLIVFTGTAEWLIEGSEAGVLTPSTINARRQTENGIGDLFPLIVDGEILYLQSRGNKIKSFSRNVDTGSYSGNDLTVYSSHLFDGKSIVDWAYQQNPDSILWTVRSDGAVLGLTYLREQQMLAWHRHDFSGGTVENVAVIPNGVEDTPYFVVNRGDLGRYIEELQPRNQNDVNDHIFMDSALSLDGTHNGSTTMTLSGGTDWDYEETLTLTASASAFVAGDVGNAIHLTGSDGTIIRFTIKGFTSATVVTGKAHKTVPTTMRSTAISTWGKAVDEISGLDHLEGENVSVYADGFVVGSPNNSAHPTYTVSGGSITLDRPYVKVHVGLPITADVETLDIDTFKGTPLGNKKKLITELTMFVEASRGIFAGRQPPTSDTTDPLEDLEELKIRNDESTDLPVSVQTDNIDLEIKSSWNSNGRVFIRQVDPLPLKILSILPTGYFGTVRS